MVCVVRTWVCEGILRPISDMSFRILFWFLFLCNLFLFHLHTPGGNLDKTNIQKDTISIACLIIQ